MEDKAERVTAILMDSLFKEDELVLVVAEGKQVRMPRPELRVVVVEGVLFRVGLHKTRLESNREKVKQILNDMPLDFFVEELSGKGGWSFLNLCTDKHGVQWGEHRNVDELICLGLALNMVRYCLPREMWQTLPGGLPYVVIDTRQL